MAKIQQDNAKTRDLKIRWKSLLSEARYLMFDCNVPLDIVSKRLKISVYRLYRIRKLNINDHVEAFERKKSKVAFEKYHQRARDAINDLLINATHPVQASEIYQMLQVKCRLNTSMPTLTKFLRSQLNVSYR